MTVTLDVEKVQKLIVKKGLKVTWVYKTLGLKRTSGYYMLHEGRLPKDDEVRCEALGKLAQILGVEAKDLLLHLRPKRVAS